METRRFVIDPAAPQTAVLAEAAAVIQRGGLVAFPTETVYGLGADALNPTAVRGIFAAKQRPSHDPIIVHIAETADLPQVAVEIPTVAYVLAEQFWPGALTLVLPKHPRVPMEITAGGPTVAVRCPSHPLAQALIRAAQTPIGAPSANRFSHTSPTTAQHVWADLAGRIDLILDGGPTTIGVESTVLDLTQPVPTLRRPGGVTVEALTAVLGQIQIPEQKSVDESAETLPSPGMMDRHYAPSTPLWLFSGGDTAVRQAMAEMAQQQTAAGKVVALMIAAEDRPFFAEHNGPVGVVGSLNNLDQVAQQLFHTIRQLDTPKTDLILARDYPEEQIGRALRDRLRRAAEQHIKI